MKDNGVIEFRRRAGTGLLGKKVCKAMETRFFQKDIETMRRPDIEALQLERLRRMVDYCYNNVPFYHERLGAAGITSGDKIKVLSVAPVLTEAIARIYEEVSVSTLFD